VIKKLISFSWEWILENVAAVATSAIDVNSKDFFIVTPLFNYL
jgi:hypothetical protein